MSRYIFLILLVWISCKGSAQTNKAGSSPIARDSFPYQKDPSMPALLLLDTDSAEFNTYFIPEGRPAVLIFFSTDCEHCQMLATELVNNMNDLQGADFYLLSPMPLTSIKKFETQYIKGHPKNIHLYKEGNHLFSRYYGVSYVPFVAIYDAHKKLLKTFEGSMKISELKEVLHKK